MIVQRHDVALFVMFITLIAGIAYSGIVIPNQSIGWFMFGISVASFSAWIYYNFFRKKEDKK